MSRALLVFCAVIWLAGCAAHHAASPRPVPLPVPRTEGYLAAARLADITPPLHLSLFGHGPESRVATGVRLRLRCEVFVIASAGEVVALVPCDLQSSSEALQRAVAERLKLAGVPIGPDRLFVMATHSHMAPAHYFDARRYSGTFSSMLPGFDERVLSFLADRIAEQVSAAFLDLQPACVGWAQEEIPGASLQLNRAYAPFLANVPPASGAPNPLAAARRADAVQEGGAVRSGRPDAPPHAALPVPRGAQAAVDDRLSVIRIDRRRPGTSACADSVPIGAFAVFGMHPTGLPNTNSLYHGDIFGYAVRVAEGELTKALGPLPGAPPRDAAWDRESAAPGDRRVIVGLANGTDGDVSPQLYEQSDPEARRLGRVLGAQIARLASSRDGLAASGTVDRLYRELRFPGARYDDDASHRLCPSGALGAVSAGGARDGPTRLRIVPEMNAGYIPDQQDACHEAKLALQAGAPGPFDYPEVGAIALVRIGDGVLAAAPGELTTMTGFRIRAALAASLPATTPVAIVGLTNHYLQYFATPEEYRFQFYEGASTLYGPHSEPFLTRHFGHLGALLGQRWAPARGGTPVPVAVLNDLPDQSPVNVPLPFEPSPSPVIRRWPDDDPVPGDLPSAPHVARVRRQLLFGYEFTLPGLPSLFTHDRRRFTVSVLEGSAVRDDDRGASIEVRELDDGTWRVRWVPDLAPCDARCGKTFALAVGGTVSVTSAPFTLVCEPARESECAP